MTSPITPNPGIHNNPQKTVSNPLINAAQSGAMATALIDGFLAQVLAALANVNIDGIKVGTIFPQLNQWATELRNDATAALTGANTANNNWTTFLTNIGLSPADIAALASWWNGLFGWLTGTSTTPALTGQVPAPAVANTTHSPQPVSNFPNPASLAAGGGWSWDGTISYNSSGG
jgi:hypothetical protein